MAAVNFTSDEARFLDALARHRVRFILVGLSAAALQGAPVVTQDVDLWFENLHDPQLVEALKETGAAYVPPFELNPPMFAGCGTELFDIVLRMDGLEKFSDEWKNTIDFVLGSEPVKVLRLDRILASKLAANRPKDKLTVLVLEDVLRALQRASSKAPPF